MSWIKKWKEINKERKVEDIEQCERHPVGWKIMMALFAFAFGTLIVFMNLSGAYPLALIAFVFVIWLEWKCFKIYWAAFPKINQAIEGLM